MKNLYEKEYEVKGRRLIYYMPKELDQHVAQYLCKELDMLIDAFGISVLELNFGKTEFMDSSGIGVILGRTKTMQFRGGSVVASGMKERLTRIFYASGLQKVVEVEEEKE